MRDKLLQITREIQPEMPQDTVRVTSMIISLNP